MANFTDVLTHQISPEQLTQLTTLMTNATALNDLVTQAVVADTAPNTLTAAGALGVTTATTYLIITGTTAYTLANGTYEGQRKYIRMTVNAGTTDAGTLTPASAVGFTTLLFNAVGEQAELEWHAGGWRIAMLIGATIAS